MAADAAYVEDLASLGDAPAPLAPRAATAYLSYIAAAAAAAAGAGKAVVGHGFAPPTFTFGFCAWLLVTAGGPRDTFLANDGYAVDEGLLTPHAAYALDVGAPLGPFAAVNATALRREFARATVTVDLEARVGDIAMHRGT